MILCIRREQRLYYEVPGVASVTERRVPPHAIAALMDGRARLVGELPGGLEVTLELMPVDRVPITSPVQSMADALAEGASQ